MRVPPFGAAGRPVAVLPGPRRHAGCLRKVAVHLRRGNTTQNEARTAAQTAALSARVAPPTTQPPYSHALSPFHLSLQRLLRLLPPAQPAQPVRGNLDRHARAGRAGRRREF